MAEKLTDPSKPAHEIIEVLGDGDAIRNDGVRLTAANKNAWYVLATIYGEQPEDADPGNYDTELAAKNRRAWNGWFCGDLSDEERADRAKKAGLKPDDLKPLDKAELDEIRQRFAARLGKGAKPPPNDQGINFSNTVFSKFVCFEKTVFEKNADFSSATFSGYADFRSAKFKSTTRFTDARFLTHVPEFHATELYDDTVFPIPDKYTDNWPPLKGEDVMSADEQKRAYNRLRLFMNKSLQIDEEQFFHRQEMRCKT